MLADARVHYPFIEGHMERIPTNWFQDDIHWIQDNEGISQTIKTLLEKKRDGYPILNTRKQLKTMIQYYSNPKSVNRKICLSGVNMYIDPYGKVHLCYGFDPVGSILNEDLMNIWTSWKAKKIRREIKKCPEMCRILNNNF